MRSLLSIALALTLAACGTDRRTPDDDGTGSGSAEPFDPDECDSSFLDYDNFGAPFVINWCRGCHSSGMPDNMRQNAPPDINFDTLDDVRDWKDKIAARAVGSTPTMPPAGGPSPEERALLDEWIACGVR